jgi:enamine deaminase RidA (YjgF/YER057c/UK114 family)
VGRIEQKLNDLGFRLGSPKPPVASYLGTKRTGNLLYVSGRKSELIGAVGDEVSEEQAKIAARDTIILMLAIIKDDIKDLDMIKGVVKMQGFIRSSENFMRQPHVLDGATELLIDLFGDEGKHARTATGVNQLPFGATIQLDMILELHDTF